MNYAGIIFILLIIAIILTIKFKGFSWVKPVIDFLGGIGK